MGLQATGKTALSGQAVGRAHIRVSRDVDAELPGGPELADDLRRLLETHYVSS